MIVTRILHLLRFDTVEYIYQSGVSGQQDFRFADPHVTLSNNCGKRTSYSANDIVTNELKVDKLHQFF